MAYTLIAGVRQDAHGRHYEFARYPSGKLVEVRVSVALVKFSCSFHSESKGHLWNFSERITVDCCGNDRCLVCGPQRKAATWYKVIKQASAASSDDSTEEA